MKNYSKIICGFICVVMLVIPMMPLGVLAAGTTALSVSTNNPAQGETFTVTATATESGRMSVKYNSNVLSVVGCDATGFTQSNGEVNFTGTRGTITFKANNAGGSPISVSSSNASPSSVVITVGATPQAGASEDFELDGVKYTVSEKFSNEEVPEGFSQTTFDINGKVLKGVTNGTMNLVYLKPIDNVAGAGKFFIYDQTTHRVSNYFFLGRADYYLIPSEPSELINDALRKGQITVDGKTVEVYTLQGVEGFVYVYGQCSDNVTGWFEYDISGNTIQRINEAIFKNVSSGGNASADAASIFDKIKSINIRYIIAGLVFLAIIVVAIIINIILKKRDDKADLVDGDEDYKGYDDSAAADESGMTDKQLAKEEKKRAKAEAKAAKAEEKAAKKEAKRRAKYAEDEEYMNEIIDEYGDFDIDRRGEVSSDTQVITLDDIENNTSKVSETSEDDDYNMVDYHEEDDDYRKVKEEAAASKRRENELDDMLRNMDKKSGDGDNEDADVSTAVAFWEDEEDVKKAMKKRKKEEKKEEKKKEDKKEKKKNIFGDDELDLTKETPKSSSRRRTSKSDIIDFNDL